MKYGVKRKSELDSTIDALMLKDRDGNDKVFFDDEEAATVAILEGIRTGIITGNYVDYETVPYDDSGNQLEKIGENDRNAAVADADALVKSNEDVRNAIGSLIAARQLYAMTSQELARLLDGPHLNMPGAPVPKFKRPAHPMTIEVLLQSVVNAGAKPFNQIDLFEGFTHTVLPWIQQRIKINTNQEMIDRRIEEDASRRARALTKVPIGLKTSPEESLEIPRCSSLTLIGNGAAVKYVIDWIVSNVLAARNEELPNRIYSVIRLCAEKAIKPSNNDRLVLVGRDHWKGSAENEKKLNTLMRDHVVTQTKYMPDLFVIDDLAAASPFSEGGAAPFVCADVHAKLMRRVKQTEMAMICGIQTSSDNINLLGSEWERMRTHSIVRQVTVLLASTPEHDIPLGMVRIVIGANAFTIDVEPGALDPVSKIIV